MNIIQVNDQQLQVFLISLHNIEEPHVLICI